MTVPNFKNEPNFISQYQAWGALNSITISVIEEYHDKIQTGGFIGSNPGIGSAIAPGSTLTITISKGSSSNTTLPEETPDLDQDDSIEESSEE